MKTKVLVTGANGQLGQTINELYKTNNKDIEFVFATKNELDITNFEELIRFFLINKFHYCINCAAYTNVEQAEESKEIAYKINAEAVKYLAIACEKQKTILIHISTDYVFNGESTIPYTETDIAKPINVYGASKLKGENYIKETTTNYFIIRTSWLYSKFGNNFVKTIIKKIKENTSLKITVAEKGTPTSCEDLSAFIFYLITSTSKAFGVYHYSNFGAITWYDFGLEIASYFSNYKKENITPVGAFITKAKRPKYSVMSKSKINISYIKAWKTSLKKTVNDLIR